MRSSEGGKLMGEISVLIPESMAKKGFRFFLFGKADACEKCELKKACVENIEPERIYEVLRVMKKSFNCPVHGEMRVCRVKKLEKTLLAIRKDEAVEGLSIRYQGPRCQELTCPNFEVCNPFGIRRGESLKIERVEELEEPCRIGMELVKCLVRVEL